jgi:hypothetical protein
VKVASIVPFTHARFCPSKADLSLRGKKNTKNKKYGLYLSE